MISLLKPNAMMVISLDGIIQSAESILFAALLFFLLLFEIWLINRGSKYFHRKTETHKFRNLKIYSVVLLDGTKQRLALRGGITALKILLILVLIYATLILVLGLFPGMESIAESLVNFIFNPLKTSFQAFVDYLPSLFTIIVIAFIFHYLKRLIRQISREVQSGQVKVAGFEPYWARTTGSIIIFILNVLLLILIFPYLPGYESLAFKGIAAFVGAMITISGSSVIANYMAGIVISYINPLKIGDLIKIEETTGEVIERTAFAIKVQTPKMVQVSIPNAKVLSTHIINYNGGIEKDRTLLHTTVSIGYDVPLKKVNELLISSAMETAGIDPLPEPFVRHIKLDDFYIVYELNGYTSDISNMFNTYSELHKNILSSFNKAGIEILSPHYEAIKDGSKTTIPEE